jgi:hypothetical protein
MNLHVRMLIFCSSFLSDSLVVYCSFEVFWNVVQMSTNSLVHLQLSVSLFQVPVNNQEILTSKVAQLICTYVSYNI